MQTVDLMSIIRSPHKKKVTYISSSIRFKVFPLSYVLHGWVSVHMSLRVSLVQNSVDLFGMELWNTFYCPTRPSGLSLANSLISYVTSSLPIMTFDVCALYSYGLSIARGEKVCLGGTGLLRVLILIVT